MQSNFSIDNPTIVKYENWFTKIFGNKDFVKLVFKLFIPAALQTLISIIVIYVDNFSLAILIDDPIKATATKDALGIANPIINFQIFVSIGWLGGTGVMMAQYFGNNDTVMTRKTTSFRIWTSLSIQVPLILVTTLIPGKLISMASNVSSGLSYDYARIYLFYTSFTFIPYIVANSLSFSLQETRRPLFSFIAAAVGMLTNIILDPIVIIASTSVEQAVMLVALTTGIARIVQTMIIIFYIILKNDMYIKFFNSWKVGRKEMSKIIFNGLPTFINECMYATLNTILIICLLNYDPLIHTATTNVVLVIEFTTIIWPGFGAASVILVGSKLGNNEISLAKENSRKLLSWAILFSLILCTLVFIVSLFVNPILSPAASIEMNRLAMQMEWIYLPIIASQGIFSIVYYSVRSGGTKAIILTDGLITLIFTIVIASVTFSKTASNWNPLLFLFFVKSEEIVKMIVSLFVYKYHNWAKALTIDQIYKNSQLDKEISEL